MGPKKLLLAFIVAILILSYILHRASSEEVFPEAADGPTAESPGYLDQPWLSPGTQPMVFDVDDYGAGAAGGDDTEAFLGAWREACNSSEYPATFLVPEGRTYQLMPVSFRGPCRAVSITAMIVGTLEAPSNRSVWLDRSLQEWITFEDVDRLHVLGGGTLNGNGQQWWANSCKVKKSMRCVTGPTALYFRRCTHLVVEDLEVRDSMQMHVAIAYSWNVLVSKLFITAPGWSPNTDGIHVSNSNEVTISECVISTGDDCIAIVTGSTIGSLGANNSWAHVSDVLVEKTTLLGTTNGVRIKTWQGGHGYAERITFQDITMHNVTNPVLIDQNYCDSKTPCHEQESAVAVHNIRYKNIRGTSASKVAVKFSCSEAVHCDGIVMQDIYLVGDRSYATCSYTKATVVQLGYNFPFCSTDIE
ncbi:hypothetical protein EJB05_07534 [Eragrostis curvula]|uniref:Pectate lyase superfamily protein domain-containing protein n=1 Tax=Eragrostis curvula TaxID=38414 RepID=A0A5J9WI73_9POAL|nr:hypothetical protein EJB05_07534 [Eragrostis curvula]